MYSFSPVLSPLSSVMPVQADSRLCIYAGGHLYVVKLLHVVCLSLLLWLCLCWDKCPYKHVKMYYMHFKQIISSGSLGPTYFRGDEQINKKNNNYRGDEHYLNLAFFLTHDKHNKLWYLSVCMPTCKNSDINALLLYKHHVSTFNLLLVELTNIK